MPERTEFEEKEYEQPLNHQLLVTSNNLWSPGQVFESVFGFDAAIFAMHPRFWTQFGITGVPVGVSLDGYRWSYFWRGINRVFRRFPSFRINLLIQAKRPHYRLGVNATYAKNGINSHYWYFNTLTHQQRILARLETKLGTDALVIYACPAFHKFADLEDKIQNALLVDHSTFVKPLKLVNHSKWVFDQPGTVGLACSEIEKVSDDGFRQQLKTLSSRNVPDQEIDGALNDLLKLERTALDICNEVQNDNPIARAFLARRERMISILEDIDFGNVSKDAVRSFSTFNLFVSILNLSWYSVQGS